MKNNYLVFKSKHALLHCFLLSLFAGIVIFGVSVLFSIRHDWNNWLNYDIDFRTFYISQKLSQDQIKNLKELDIVSNVIPSSAYTIKAKTTFLEDNNEGLINIAGIPDEDIQELIESQEDLKKDKIIICPKQLRPENITNHYNDVDYIDLTSEINKNITVSFNNTNEKFTLLGIYDNEKSASANNTCYSTYETVQKMNEQYNPNNNNDTYYVITKKNVDIKTVINTLKNLGFTSNTIGYNEIDYKYKIMSAIAFGTIMFGIISFLLTFASLLKDIQNYSLDEVFMLGLISYAIAVVYSFVGFLIMEKKILINNEVFAKMDMTYSYIALTLGVLITFVMPIILNKKLRNKTSKRKKRSN